MWKLGEKAVPHLFYHLLSTMVMPINTKHVVWCHHSESPSQPYCLLLVRGREIHSAVMSHSHVLCNWTLQEREEEMCCCFQWQSHISLNSSFSMKKSSTLITLAQDRPFHIHWIQVAYTLLSGFSLFTMSAPFNMHYWISVGLIHMSKGALHNPEG